jgi:signal transducing adaptor molecule
MQELYDSLKARKMFDAVDEAPKVGGGAAVAADEERRERLRREEEEELARVLELSMRDKGGRGGAEPKRTGEGSAGPSGSSVVQSQPQHEQRTAGPAPTASAQPFIARNPTPPPVTPSKATAARVRAIYPFTTTERGELSFEKGDVIKVIDRMYDEWYTGAVGGRIGIFPVSYVVSSRTSAMSDRLTLRRNLYRIPHRQSWQKRPRTRRGFSRPKDSSSTSNACSIVWTLREETGSRIVPR